MIQSVLLDHQDLTGLYQVSVAPIDKHALLVLLNAAFDAGVEIAPNDEFKCDRSLDSTLFRSLTGYGPSTWDAMVREMANDANPYELWRNK